MIVHYGNEAEYPNGFQNKFRNDISFIINRDLGDKLNISESFDIYEVEGRSLDEAMTEIITNNGRTGFSLSYNTQKGLLNYFMERSFYHGI